MVDLVILLLLLDSIYFVFIKIDFLGDIIFIGLYFFIWRDILLIVNGRMMCFVEINGVGIEVKVFMGILEIKFEMILRFS